ncbi:hypothetical protein V6Z11_D08G116500 [Gossypium hirsutum]
MADVEEPKKLESETPSDPPPPPTEAAVEEFVTPPPPTEEKPADSTEKPPEPIEKAAEAAESTEKKSTEVSVDRGNFVSPSCVNKILSCATEKRISLINAWEESEKSKAENNTEEASSIAAWENTKKAAIEAELKGLSQARGGSSLKAEELAAKYRATGTTPNKTLGF